MPPTPRQPEAAMSSAARSWLTGQMRWERLLDDLRTAHVGRAVDAAVMSEPLAAPALTTV